MALELRDEARAQLEAAQQQMHKDRLQAQAELHTCRAELEATTKQLSGARNLERRRSIPILQVRKVSDLPEMIGHSQRRLRTLVAQRCVFRVCCRTPRRGVPSPCGCVCCVCALRRRVGPPAPTGAPHDSRTSLAAQVRRMWDHACGV